MNKKFTNFFVSRSVLLTMMLLCASVAISSASATRLPVSAQEVQAPASKSTLNVTLKVYEEDGMTPVIGAVVASVQNPSNAVLSDVTGMALLKNMPSDGSITVSFLGMLPKTVAIENRSEITVLLTADAIGIEDVVVVGFGTQKKVNLTGAVASVSGKVLESRPISNLGQGLQGVIPNLNITTGNGTPGQGSSYNVRGGTSLNGGSPLILVDGVQMDPNLINPQDVASVSVLKDAASAAIYGARGAYGVILITTKQGRKNQKPTVSANINLGLHQPTYTAKTPGTVEYVNYMNMVTKNSGWSGAMFDAEYMDAIAKYQANPTPENSVFIHSQSTNKNQYDYAGETEWYSAMMNKVALNQQYNVSVSGGTDNTQYFMSMGLIKDRGLLKSYEDTYTRWNTNINVNSQVTKWLSVTGKAVYNYSINDMPRGTGGDVADWNNTVFLEGLRPTMPVRHPDGHYSGQGIWSHPLAMAEQGGSSKTKKNDLWLTGAIKATPIKGMNIVADYTFNYYGQDNHSNMREFYEYNAVPGTEDLYPWTKPSSVGNSANNDTYVAFNSYIDYERQMGKHYLKAMVGYNQESKSLRGFGAQRSQMVNNDSDYIGLAMGETTLYNNVSSRWGLEGVVFRLNYNYDERYFLEVNGRYDTSSKYPAGNRSGFFPSASVAWRLSQEQFMEGASSWLSELKFRASYGSLGNQSTLDNVNFPYYPAFGVNTSYNYLLGGKKPVAISAPGLVSNNFTWETVSQMDFGVDFGFFGNRLTGVFDWYERQTLNMLGPSRLLPSQLGTGAPRENSANMKTSGWELALRWNDRTSGGFNYGVGIVLSDYQSVVTKYNNPTGSLTTFYAGRNTGEIWGYTTQGKFQNQQDIDSHVNQSAIYGGTWYAGDIKYADLNGDGKINNGKNTLEDHGDLSIIGNTSPRYSFGVTFNADWKGIDLDVFFQGVGQRNYMPGGSTFWGAMNEWRTPISWQMGNYWTEENPNGYLPRQSFNNGNRQTQTGYLQDAGYLRLKQLTLGYTFPAKWMSKAKISKLRIYFSGQNLFTFTKLPQQYDPETLNQGAYPVQRIYSFGLNLNF